MTDQRCFIPAFMRCVALIAVALSASCSGEAPDESDGLTQIRLIPSIAGVEANETRAMPAVITSDSFLKEAAQQWDLGLMVFTDDQFTPYMQSMANMKVTYDTRLNESDRWTYEYGGTTHNKCGFRPGANLTIYSYYPYSAGSAGNPVDPTSIPVQTSTDVLWGDPVSVTAQGSTMDIPIQMHHACACLRISIATLKNKSYTLNSVSLIDNAASEGKILYKEATIDLTDKGKISLKEENAVDKLSFTSLGFSFDGTVKYAYFPIIPVAEFSPGQFSLSLTYGTRTDTFTLPDCLDADGNVVNSFELGKMYTFPVRVDDNATFTAGGISTQWTIDDPADSINIDI